MTIRLKKRAGKCFYAWSDHVYMVSEGLDRKRWKGPRKYEIRYNQKRVNTFARKRAIAYVWYPWSQFFRMEKAVKKSMQRQVARFVKENFLGMKQVIQEQRRLRNLTVSSWKEYANLMVSTIIIIIIIIIIIMIIMIIIMITIRRGSLSMHGHSSQRTFGVKTSSR